MASKLKSSSEGWLHEGACTAISVTAMHLFGQEELELNTFFTLLCSSELDSKDIAKELSKWQIVSGGYPDPIPTDAAINPDDDPYFTSQGYLLPEPVGIDAVYAWGIPGGDGEGQVMVDAEQGWTFGHDDLVAKNCKLLYGDPNDSSRHHGTAVLGEICAQDNNLGCVGIVPRLAAANAVSP